MKGELTEGELERGKLKAKNALDCIKTAKRLLQKIINDLDYLRIKHEEECCLFDNFKDNEVTGLVCNCPKCIIT